MLYTKTMNIKTIAPHVTSSLAALGAVLAIVHPGFQIPTVTQSIATTLCVLVAGAIQGFHLISHRSLVANIAAAEQYAIHASAIASQPAPAAPQS